MVYPLCMAAPPALESLFDLVVKGGPVMVPIGICSVVALAYVIERWIRLGRGRLGGARFRGRVLAAARDGGLDAMLAACRSDRSVLARVLCAAGDASTPQERDVEKAVEDAAGREVRKLSANLKPLIVVASIAPLLGLFGTVWGMILAFSTMALQDGRDRPEMLAAGIAQALITTAAGLAVAIPTQAAYFLFRARIDRFVRDAEDLWVELAAALRGGSGAPVRHDAMKDTVAEAVHAHR